MGQYLCYRFYKDQKVRIRQIINNEKESHEQHICLKTVLTEADSEKVVTFSRIPKNSFQMIKNDDEYYDCLLELVVRNDTYIFSLDDEKP